MLFSSLFFFLPFLTTAAAAFVRTSYSSSFISIFKLPMYERHSMLCLNKGQHYLSEALRRKELCEAWLLARQRQRSALAAAVRVSNV